LFAAALASLALTAASPTAPALADPPLKTQAIGIMSVSYGEFMRLKASQGRNPRFDWASDGCSGPWWWASPPALLAARWMHTAPCEQHDFGHRNFGHGLRLEPTEARREWVDGRFRDEMLRNCRDHRWYPNCVQVAFAFHATVRAFGRWG
jgi:hypothetical protein